MPADLLSLIPLLLFLAWGMHPSKREARRGAGRPGLVSNESGANMDARTVSDREGEALPPWPGPFPDPCPACEGQGGDPVDGQACRTCAGTGTAEYVRSIPGPRCDLDRLAPDEFVVANVPANCWDVYRDRMARCANCLDLTCAGCMGPSLTGGGR